MTGLASIKMSCSAVDHRLDATTSAAARNSIREPASVNFRCCPAMRLDASEEPTGRGGDGDGTGEHGADLKVPGPTWPWVPGPALNDTQVSRFLMRFACHARWSTDCQLGRSMECGVYLSFTWI